MSKEMGLFERLVLALEIIAQSSASLSRGSVYDNAAPTTTVVTPTKAEPEATKAETKPKTPTAAEKKAAAAAEAAAAAAAAPKFDYDVLKASIIALAQLGPEGREQVIRIMSEAGLDRTQKASDAEPSKWESMNAKAVEAFQKLSAGEDFA